MCNFEQAVNLAKEYFSESNIPDIINAFDADKMWIFVGGIKGVPMVGNPRISISKETGEIKFFALPSKENFEILNNATKIEI